MLAIVDAYQPAEPPGWSERTTLASGKTSMSASKWNAAGPSQAPPKPATSDRKRVSFRALLSACQPACWALLKTQDSKCQTSPPSRCWSAACCDDVPVRGRPAPMTRKWAVRGGARAKVAQKRTTRRPRSSIVQGLPRAHFNTGNMQRRSSTFEHDDHDEVICAAL